MMPVAVVRREQYRNAAIAGGETSAPHPGAVRARHHDDPSNRRAQGGFHGPLQKGFAVAANQQLVRRTKAPRAPGGKDDGRAQPETLDLDLAAQFHDAVWRQPEELHGRFRIAQHPGE